MVLLKVLGIIFTCIGGCLLYLSHANQIFLRQPLPHQYKWIGVGCLILSLIILLINQTALIAFFLWWLCIATIWSFVPFLQVIFKNE